MKAQHEGALPPPCIVRKDPRNGQQYTDDSNPAPAREEPTVSGEDSVGSGAGTLGVPLGGTRRVGGLLARDEGHLFLHGLESSPKSSLQTEEEARPRPEVRLPDLCSFQMKCGAASNRRSERAHV